MVKNRRISPFEAICYLASDSVTKLEKNWDSFKADPPNAPSIAKARKFLLGCGLQEVDRVSPTSVGGIAITFRNKYREVFIEFYNNEKVFALFSEDDSEQMDVKEVTDNGKLIVQIKEYLGLS